MCSVHNIERSLRKVVTSEYRSWSLAYMAVFEAVQIHLMICSARKWRLRLIYVFTLTCTVTVTSYF